MINKYDNVDFCINTLFGFTYSKKKSDICYKVKYIQKNNIKLLDIKKQPDFKYEDIFKRRLRNVKKVLASSDYVKERKRQGPRGYIPKQ